MPIKIVYEEDELRPYVFCDYCNKKIVGEGEGNYEYEMGDGRLVSENIFFTHKHCSNAFRRSHGEKGFYYYSGELDWFTGYLKNNLKAY